MFDRMGAISSMLALLRETSHLDGVYVGDELDSLFEGGIQQRLTTFTFPIMSPTMRDFSVWVRRSYSGEPLTDYFGRVVQLLGAIRAPRSASMLVWTMKGPYAKIISAFTALRDAPPYAQEAWMRGDEANAKSAPAAATVGAPAPAPADKIRPITPESAPADSIIKHAPAIISGAGLDYVPMTPDIPEAGVDASALFLGGDSTRLAKFFDSYGRANGYTRMSDLVIQDLAKNSKFLGLAQAMPQSVTRNIIVAESHTQSTSILSIEVGGKAYGLIAINPSQIKELLGAYCTSTVLRALTHELGHYTHDHLLSNTLKLRWKRLIANEVLHPTHGKLRYKFDTEHFAVLAEALVWGQSVRGLYNVAGHEVAATWFTDNFNIAE